MPKLYSQRLPETIVLKVSTDMKATLTDLAHEAERTVGAQVRYLIRSQLEALRGDHAEEYTQDDA